MSTLPDDAPHAASDGQADALADVQRALAVLATFLPEGDDRIVRWSVDEPLNW